MQPLEAFCDSLRVLAEPLRAGVQLRAAARAGRRARLRANPTHSLNSLCSRRTATSSSPNKSMLSCNASE